jgi:hypothetical protein
MAETTLAPDYTTSAPEVEYKITWEDYLVIAAYFVAVFAVGIFVSADILLFARDV